MSVSDGSVMLSKAERPVAEVTEKAKRLCARTLNFEIRCLKIVDTFRTSKIALQKRLLLSGSRVTS